ncbi:MAG: hypothetical protein ABIE03_04665 [Patescibacteria group bacterium]|nr:hypothetical protein [Patescibacteria group bacterium]
MAGETKEVVPISRRTVLRYFLLAAGAAAVPVGLFIREHYDFDISTRPATKKDIARVFEMGRRNQACFPFLPAADRAILRADVEAQVDRLTIYSHAGKEIRVFHPATFAVPDVRIYEQAIDFLYEHHDTGLYKLMGKGLKPPRIGYIFVLDLSAETLPGDRYFYTFSSHTQTSVMTGGITFSLVNLAQRTELRTSPFWVELAQAYDMGSVDLSLVQIWTAKDSLRISELRNNVFGLAVYCAQNGLTFGEYQVEAKRSGHVPGLDELVLEPYSESWYNEIVAIFQ